jgi:AraC-like DNA-binding protein
MVTGIQRQLRVGAAITLPRIIRNLGHDPIAAFTAVDIDPQLFEDSENRIEAAKLGALLEESARITNRPDIGLLVANDFGPATLGLIGLIVAEGPNLQTSLRNLVRLLYHNDRAAYLSLTTIGDFATLRYELQDNDFAGCRVILDGAIGIGMRIIQSLLGTQWRPTEIRLSRKEPKDCRAYQEFFKVPIHFSSLDDAVIFPAIQLNTPIKSPPRHALFSQLDYDSRSIVEKVQYQIATCMGLEKVTGESIAQMFDLSRRSLNRKLKEHNTSFGKLDDSVRFARARHLLSAGDAPLSDIASAIGYLELSAFSRAFRRWAGVSPSLWRELQADNNLARWGLDSSIAK